ncbi:MAG: NUDIX domain-containing protein [Lachnospiraceae bacterium]|nr:NUDIX domain-containing protein [Lachnospiraceae bacterium]
MKRKRLDRDVWGFQYFPYYQMRVETEHFKGLVALIRLTSGEPRFWDFPKDGKTEVCGAGMTWLQMVPDGREHMVTAKYLENGRVSVWYVDILDAVEYDKDGIAVYVDKYLDVIFTPQGDVLVDDRDELDAAYASGELSKEQYESALAEGEAVLKEYCTDFEQTERYCNEVLAFMNQKIEEGARDYKTVVRETLDEKLKKRPTMRPLFCVDMLDYEEDWPHSARPSVRGIIWKDNKLAMVHSLKYDYYKFPGGGIEGDEAHEATLIREVKEETGLDVKPETIKEYGFVLRLQKSDYLENTIFEQENFYYTCEVTEVTGEQKLDDYEAEEGFTLEFVTPEEAIRTNQHCHCTEWDKAMVERETRVLEGLKRAWKVQQE